MMLTLKIIGLAFEAHQSFNLKNKKQDNNQDQLDVSKNEEQIFEMDRYNFELTFADIFHYIFNYCGVLTGIILYFIVQNCQFAVVQLFSKTSFILGPYFRYTTYLDHLNKPYHRYANLKDAVTKRIYLLPFVAAVYFILNYYWPLSVSICTGNSQSKLLLF